MSLLAVTAQLRQWADSAALKAGQANHPDSVAALAKAAEQFRAMLEAVQGAAGELSAMQAQIAAMPAPRAPTVRRKAGIGALEFWRRHGLAVNAIIAQHGLGWQVRAPIEDVVLVQVPSCWRSAVTERGTKVTWRKDWRMPCARYWPDGVLPTGMEVSDDYPRAYVPVAYGPPEAGDQPHDAAWHRERGYQWDGLTPAWRFEIEIRNGLNREDGITAYRAAKAKESQDDELTMMMAAE